MHSPTQSAVSVLCCVCIVSGHLSSVCCAACVSVSAGVLSGDESDTVPLAPATSAEKGESAGCVGGGDCAAAIAADGGGDADDARPLPATLSRRSDSESCSSPPSTSLRRALMERIDAAPFAYSSAGSAFSSVLGCAGVKSGTISAGVCCVCGSVECAGVLLSD